MPATEQTLTQALKEIGVTHVKSMIAGYHWIYSIETGELIDTLDAPQGWALVHQAQAAA